MSKVFIDNAFWVARTVPHDKHRIAAMAAYRKVEKAHFYTTDEVLVEYLNYCCALGQHGRSLAVRNIEIIFHEPLIAILPQTRQSFLDGLILYQKRHDKQYSLTDCISMYQMRTHGIRDVLTTDRHFAQEGFNVLINL